MADNKILITIDDSEAKTTIKKTVVGNCLTAKTAIEVFGVEFVSMGLRSGYSDNDLRNFIISTINIVKYELEKNDDKD